MEHPSDIYEIASNDLEPRERYCPVWALSSVMPSVLLPWLIFALSLS